MPIKDFELFHGAVLTKLVRNDQPAISLRLIETNPQEAWAFYRINDEVDLFIKYRAKVRERKREPDALVWHFIFTPEQIQQMRIRIRERQVFTALVCGQKEIGSTMFVCFLTPENISKLINLDEQRNQSVMVKYMPRRQLRVSKRYQHVEVVIPQKALENWHVPGS